MFGVFSAAKAAACGVALASVWMWEWPSLLVSLREVRERSQWGLRSQSLLLWVSLRDVREQWQWQLRLLWRSVSGLVSG